MVSYRSLINELKRQHKYPISIKSNFTVVTIPGIDYHITIFQDQWDDYQKTSGKPYHLFHVSSNKEDNRCSSYFWVGRYTMHIKKIPRKYFSYNQPSYSFFSSTRNPCHLRDIQRLLVVFQHMLNSV